MHLPIAPPRNRLRPRRIGSPSQPGGPYKNPLDRWPRRLLSPRVSIHTAQTPCTSQRDLGYCPGNIRLDSILRRIEHRFLLTRCPGCLVAARETRPESTSRSHRQHLTNRLQRRYHRPAQTRAADPPRLGVPCTAWVRSPAYSEKSRSPC